MRLPRFIILSISDVGSISISSETGFLSSVTNIATIITDMAGNRLVSEKTGFRAVFCYNPYMVIE